MITSCVACVGRGDKSILRQSLVDHSTKYATRLEPPKLLSLWLCRTLAGFEKALYDLYTLSQKFTERWRRIAAQEVFRPAAVFWRYNPLATDAAWMGKPRCRIDTLDANDDPPARGEVVLIQETLVQT